VAGDRLVWLVNSSGTLTAYRLKDGSKAYEKELEMNVRSSPSLAGDRLYVTSDKGVTLILASGEEFKELGRNELGERMDASPAFQDGRIYLRGKDHLFAIGRK
jgi:outer membrane protein assembly factor BamB